MTVIHFLITEESAQVNTEQGHVPAHPKGRRQRSKDVLVWLGEYNKTEEEAEEDKFTWLSPILHHFGPYHQLWS